MVLRLCAAVLVLVAGALAQNASVIAGANAPLSERYDADIAIDLRRAHFYCNPVGQTRDNFPQFTPSSNTENQMPLAWAIFLQYPVLSYLDSARKTILLRNIAALVRIGASDTTELENFSEAEFCIGRVYHYRVADYDESVLVNLYFTPESVVISQNGTGMVSIQEFNAAFMRGFSIEENRDSTLIQQFEERSAIVVDATQNPTDTNQHPGAATLSPGNDPTLRAVFIASFAGPTNLDMAVSAGGRPAAENPNPTNFGLEPGDIVFAVFGSIFLTIVGALILLGFCIHPFFLA